MIERWAQVPGFPAYEVSDLGRIRSARGVLKPWLDRQGYFRVRLWANGKRRSWLVNRLVMTAFAGPGDGLDACHNNGVKTDNRLANLRWGTRAENIRDQVTHGTHVNARKTHCKRGHALTPDNTYASQPGRVCIACARARANERYVRKSERKAS